ncbi:hypothetical protein QJQ45_008340 [Haematococcus lacustris]|nr:hypothetical protein QJQ45_008340 [Haematococcus lacustris]
MPPGGGVKAVASAVKAVKTSEESGTPTSLLQAKRASKRKASQPNMGDLLNMYADRTEARRARVYDDEMDKMQKTWQKHKPKLELPEKPVEPHMPDVPEEAPKLDVPGRGAGSSRGKREQEGFDSDGDVDGSPGTVAARADGDGVLEQIRGTENVKISLDAFFR